jgi:hypothetical protein
MSKAAELAALIGSQSSLSNRNLIINGGMQVAQRGTSVTGLGDGTVGYVGLDRFRLQKSGSPLVRYTMTQDSNAPAGFNNSMKLEVTTADASVSSDHLQYIDQFIEAQNLQQLSFGNSSAKSITLSFYVKCSTAQTFALELINEDNSRYFNTTYVVSSADTWERKTITFPADTASGFNDDNGRGLRVRWILAAGSNFTDGSVSTAWSGTQHIATNHQNTWVADTSRTWQITGVQLEVGEQATPFEHPRSYGDELAKCQRYYYSHADGASQSIGFGANYSSSLLTCQIHFPVTMRSSPTLVQGSGTDYYRFRRSNGSDLFNSFTATQTPSTNSVALDCNANISGTQGDGGRVQTENASAYIHFDSEL